MSTSEESRCRLYLITPPRIDDLEGFATQLTEALGAGDVACLQIRLKELDDEGLKQAVSVLKPICLTKDVAVILNDRPDLAAETGCDGCHIGPDDMPYVTARKIVGDDAIIGVTCKASHHDAMVAADQGADYVAFGAFFTTATKADTTPAPLELLEAWSSTTIVPCVAIGGITVDNCPPLIAAGADFLAVSGGVWQHPSGAADAVRLFNEQFEENSAS